jgi:hypothetical protein
VKEDRAKAKGQEKALQPLGKVERVALETVAKAKVLENPVVKVKAVVPAKALVKEAEAVKALGQEKEAEAVKAKALAKVKAKEKDKAKAEKVAKAKDKEKDKAKAENLVMETHRKVLTKNLEEVDKVLHPAKANNVVNVMVVATIVPILPKIVLIVMALDKNHKIILKTLWMIS